MLTQRHVLFCFFVSVSTMMLVFILISIRRIHNGEKKHEAFLVHPRYRCNKERIVLNRCMMKEMKNKRYHKDEKMNTWRFKRKNDYDTENIPNRIKLMREKMVRKQRKIKRPSMHKYRPERIQYDKRFGKTTNDAVKHELDELMNTVI